MSDDIKIRSQTRLQALEREVDLLRVVAAKLHAFLIENHHADWSQQFLHMDPAIISMANDLSR